jgi:hypothetical protein
MQVQVQAQLVVRFHLRQDLEQALRVVHLRSQQPPLKSVALYRFVLVDQKVAAVVQLVFARVQQQTERVEV